MCRIKRPNYSGSGEGSQLGRSPQVAEKKTFRFMSSEFDVIPVDSRVLQLLEDKMKEMKVSCMLDLNRALFAVGPTPTATQRKPKWRVLKGRLLSYLSGIWWAMGGNPQPDWDDD